MHQNNIDTQITPVILTAPCSIQNAKSGNRYSIVCTQNYLSLLYHIFTFFLADFVARIGTQQLFICQFIFLLTIQRKKHII